jgi:fucose permease
MVTAVMADQLMADFNIGAASLGNFSSFYYYSYVAVQIPTGILADYWGPRKLLTGGALLSSVGAFLFASASSIHTANSGRLIIGASMHLMGEPGLNWASNPYTATKESLKKWENLTGRAQNDCDGEKSLFRFFAPMLLTPQH